MNIIKFVFKGDAEAVIAAIKEDPKKIDSVDSDGRTGLMHAVIDKKYEIALLLLKNGADPNLRDRNGRAPLHFAAQGYETIMASMLLDHGAQIDPLDENGNSPLSNAVFNSQGNGPLITLLITKGAKKDLKMKGLKWLRTSV